MKLGFDMLSIYQTFVGSCKVSGLFVGMMVLPVLSSCLVLRKTNYYVNEALLSINVGKFVTTCS
jgi:hypothetical protein